MKIKNNFTKRILMCLLVFALVPGLFAGCGREKKVQTVKKTKIELWHYWDLPYQRRELTELIEEFNASQDKIALVTRYIPDADFKKELALSMSEGTEPDLALVDSADFQYFDHMQEFEDLTGQIEGLNTYLPVSLLPGTIDGKIKGLPIGLNCIGLYYNKSMLSSVGLGVPDTWEKFYEAAKKMTTGQTYGYAQAALEGEESLYGFLPMLWSMGGDVDALDSPESRKAFDLLKALVQTGTMNKESISLTGSDLAGQFAQGNIAMMLNGSMMADYILEQNPHLDFGVSYIPAGKGSFSVIGGEIFGVLDEKHKEEAVTFLNFIADKQKTASNIDQLGYLAPRADVMAEQYPDSPINHQFIDIFKTAKTREFSKDWPAVSEVVQEAVSEIIIGNRDEEEVLSNAAKQIRMIREENR